MVYTIYLNFTISRLLIWAIKRFWLIQPNTSAQSFYTASVLTLWPWAWCIKQGIQRYWSWLLSCTAHFWQYIIIVTVNDCTWTTIVICPCSISRGAIFLAASDAIIWEILQHITGHQGMIVYAYASIIQGKPRMVQRNIYRVRVLYIYIYMYSAISYI